MKRTPLLALSLFWAANMAFAQQPPTRLWYDKPATCLEESLPIGNGKLGALVYGNPNDDAIHLYDLTFWTGMPVDSTMDANAHEWIPKTRKALFAENYPLADSLQKHVQEPDSQFHQPLGTLRVRDLSQAPCENYHRELDLDSSLVKINYQKDGIRYTREYFASYPDKLIALRIKANKPGGINCEISLTAQVPHSVKASQAQLTLTGHAVGDPKESIHYCGIVRTFYEGGHMSVSGSTLTLRGANTLTLYFVNETSFNGYDKHPVKEGARYLEKAMDEAWHVQNDSYENFRERHIADYRRHYDRLRLHLEGTGENTDLPTDKRLKEYTDKNANDTYLETQIAGLKPSVNKIH